MKLWFYPKCPVCGDGMQVCVNQTGTRRSRTITIDIEEIEPCNNGCTLPEGFPSEDALYDAFYDNEMDQGIC